MSKIYPEKFIVDQIILNSKINNQLIITKFAEYYIINYQYLSFKINKNSISRIKIINNRIFININNNNLEYNYEWKILNMKKLENFFD